MWISPILTIGTAAGDWPAGRAGWCGAAPAPWSTWPAAWWSCVRPLASSVGEPRAGLGVGRGPDDGPTVAPPTTMTAGKGGDDQKRSTRDSGSLAASQRSGGDGGGGSPPECGLGNRSSVEQRALHRLRHPTSPRPEPVTTGRSTAAVPGRSGRRHFHLAYRPPARPWTQESEDLTPGGIGVRNLAGRPGRAGGGGRRRRASPPVSPGTPPGALDGLVAGDPDPRVRAAALGALARLPGPPPAAWLRAAALRHRPVRPPAGPATSLPVLVGGRRAGGAWAPRRPGRPGGRGGGLGARRAGTGSGGPEAVGRLAEVGTVARRSAGEGGGGGGPRRRSGTLPGWRPCWPPAVTSRPSGGGRCWPWRPSTGPEVDAALQEPWPTRTGRPDRRPKTCSAMRGLASG